MKTQLLALFFSFLFINSALADAPVTSADDSADQFVYTIKNPRDTNAQKYVISRSNIQITDEEESTYWLPSSGGETMGTTTPGIMIYHFPLSRPIQTATLFAGLHTFHWTYSVGHDFLYVSPDNINWIKITELDPPSDNGGWTGNSSVDLPAVFSGRQDIYVKIELYSYGPKAHRGPPWTNTAQHLRYFSERDNTTFRLEVQYDSRLHLVPESQDDMQAGDEVTFEAIDAHGGKIENSKLTWRVVRQKSIDPAVSTDVHPIGEIDNTGRFTAMGIGTCRVRATLQDNTYAEAEVTVKCNDRPGNLDRVIELYHERIPNGPVLADKTAGRLNPVLDHLSPGWATDLLAQRYTEYGDYTCIAYQYSVLEFLHAIKSDPEQCSLLNGLEFGPVEISYGGHHAVVIYPSGTDWINTGTVLDPWGNQTPETFSMDKWNDRYRGDPFSDTSSEYDNLYETTGSLRHEGSDFYAGRDALWNKGKEIARTLGIIDCPVKLMFTDEQGRRSGLDDADNLYAEIPGVILMAASNGEDNYEWFFAVDEDAGNCTLEIDALKDGQFDIVTLIDRSVYHYGTQTILKDRPAHIDFASLTSSPVLTLYDSTEIEPQGSILRNPRELCWEWSLDAGLDISVPRFIYNGSYFTVFMEHMYDLYWTPVLDSLIQIGPGDAVRLDDNLTMELPCLEYRGIRFGFNLVYDHDLVWKLDLNSLEIE